MESKLTSWVNRINAMELPIFKGTLNSVTHMTARDNISSNELSKVILKDVTLTARILRIANSIFYNPMSAKINTISRAVMYIGFNNIRDIAMSLAVFDTLLRKQSRTYVVALMARSFHAAVQARDMAEQRHDSTPEEVFIAALLYHFGEMTFWCIKSLQAEQLIKSMDTDTYEPDLAQQQILGFRFKELTAEISKEWHLGSLLYNALKNRNRDDPRIKDILLGSALSDASLKGWSNQQTQKVLKDIAKHLDLSVKAVSLDAAENAKKAVDVANSFGATQAALMIPVPGVDAKDNSLGKSNKQIQEHVDYPDPDPVLQLNILRDLSGMIDNKPEFNTIVGIILEGMHRGIGMDRTLFAIINKNMLHVKFALGIHIEDLEKKFKFSIDRNEHSVFSWVIDKNQSVWVTDKNKLGLTTQAVNRVSTVVQGDTFIVNPVKINNNVIGIFYSDRIPSQRDIDVTIFESCKHFAQQAMMALEHISR